MIAGRDRAAYQRICNLLSEEGRKGKAIHEITDSLFEAEDEEIQEYLLKRLKGKEDTKENRRLYVDSWVGLWLGNRHLEDGVREYYAIRGIDSQFHWYHLDDVLLDDTKRIAASLRRINLAGGIIAATGTLPEATRKESLEALGDAQKAAEEGEEGEAEAM